MLFISTSRPGRDTAKASRRSPDRLPVPIGLERVMFWLAFRLAGDWGAARLYIGEVPETILVAGRMPTPLSKDPADSSDVPTELCNTVRFVLAVEDVLDPAIDPAIT